VIYGQYFRFSFYSHKLLPPYAKIWIPAHIPQAARAAAIEETNIITNLTRRPILKYLIYSVTESKYPKLSND